jgi:hypothetical protein
LLVLFLSGTEYREEGAGTHTEENPVIHTRGNEMKIREQSIVFISLVPNMILTDYNYDLNKMGRSLSLVNSTLKAD